LLAYNAEELPIREEYNLTLNLLNADLDVQTSVPLNVNLTIYDQAVMSLEELIEAKAKAEA